MRWRGMQEKIALLLLGLCLLPEEAFGSCDSFFKFKNTTNVGEINLQFSLSVKEDLSSYVIGFKFSRGITELKIYGNRSALKVNESLWFVTRQENFPLRFIDFDLQLVTPGQVQIDDVSFNGKMLCQRVTEVSECSQTSSQQDGYSKTATFAAIIVSTLILCTLMGKLLSVFLSFKKLTFSRWNETQSSISAIERSLSVNNPNLKNIPLPSIPGSSHKNPLNKFRGTYIEVGSTDCNNSDCTKTYSMLRDVIERLSSSTITQFKFLEELSRVNSIIGKEDADLNYIRASELLES